MSAPSDKSLESWLWDAACSIRGAKDAPKFKDFILPLVFTKRLCDVFDDEINRIADKVGSRAKTFKLVKADKKLVRFFLPLQPRNPEDSVWSVIRTGNDTTRPAADKYQEKLGQELTTYLREIADANPLLKGIIDRIDFNATSRKGRTQEPHSWAVNALHKVLSNPLYHGAIRHKGSEYPGEHEAIIGSNLWNAVQTKLREHQPEFRKTSGHFNEIATAKTRLIHPLKGFVFGIDGQALTPTYTNKSQKSANGTKTRKRYRYYVSQQAIRQGYGSSPLKTLSASLLEDAARRILIHALPGLSEYISLGELSSSEIQHRLSMHAAYLAQLDTGVIQSG